MQVLNPLEKSENNVKDNNTGNIKREWNDETRW
jgi:hypothetical protein